MKDLKFAIMDFVSYSVYNAWVENEDLRYDEMCAFRSSILSEMEVFLDGKRFHKLCQSLSDHSKNDR